MLVVKQANKEVQYIQSTEIRHIFLYNKINKSLDTIDLCHFNT